uniref:DDE Tnp4 domain-containing protein n=1 Tax=Ditylenchus dipsaci TaxID=166011 RepID=A0A915E977_9BILA
MWEKRHRSGSYRILLPELKQHAEKFHSYMRMNLSEFNNLLAVVTPWLTRRSIRTPINPEERLMLTLRFLATGEAFRSLSFQFRLGISTVSKIVASTCCAIFNALKTDYLQVPATEEEWIDIAAKFFSRWNCPNTLGAIDGKHVLIKRPPHSGSLYYNYKGTFSTVLLAVCDADYRCIYASYGHYGHQGMRV